MFIQTSLACLPRCILIKGKSFKAKKSPRILSIVFPVEWRDCIKTYFHSFTMIHIIRNRKYSAGNWIASSQLLLLGITSHFMVSLYFWLPSLTWKSSIRYLCLTIEFCKHTADRWQWNTWFRLSVRDQQFFNLKI